MNPAYARLALHSCMQAYSFRYYAHKFATNPLYVFVPSDINGKYQLFTLWGYDIMDSEYLQQEFQRQAMIAYSTGIYELDKRDDYGQRINITITIKRKDNGEYVTFQSGWMVYPDGRIVLVTPYGDR